MRIVIDMQGAQGEGSRNRGIGRYTLSLAKALIRNRANHEIFLAVNGCFPESIVSIRTVMNELLPQQNICVWYPPIFLSNQEETDTWHRKAAQLLREAFLASLKPDIVLVSSLFEGFGDDVVTSIGEFNSTIPTFVILYDLIPFIHRAIYLNNPLVEAWYEQKIVHLLRCDRLLAISESSRQEAITYLGFSPDACINISAAVEGQFYKKQIDSTCEQVLRARYGLSRQFVMYTGGIDYRKNVDGLIRAYAKLPKVLRSTHQLAIVCSIQRHNRTTLMKLAKKVGLTTDEVVFTGFVSDDDLLTLYNLCKVFVFPSWHEGFGLPALEAMSCGRAVIGANTSSLPEVVGKAEALFDPKNDKAIADKLMQVLTDDAFRLALEAHGLQQSQQFSWDISAQRAMVAFENFHEKRIQQSSDNTTVLPRSTFFSQQEQADIAALITSIANMQPAPTDEQSWREVAQAIAHSFPPNMAFRQLFVDISCLIVSPDTNNQAQTIIHQRLRTLLEQAPEGFRVEPVYATREQGYRYARRFMLNLLGCAETGLQDDVIDYQASDVFLGLDIPESILSVQQAFYQQLRTHGVNVDLEPSDDLFQKLINKDVNCVLS